MRRRSISSLRVAGLSFAGVVGGHLATYLLIAPDPHDREAMLAATGHGSWTLPIFLAVAAFLAVACGYAGGRSKGSMAYAPLVVRLAALQMGGFALLEVSERAATQGLSSSILSDPALLLGTAVQLLVALIAPLLVWVLALSVDRVRRFFLPSPNDRGAATSTWQPLIAPAIPSSPWTSSRPSRAPPLLTSI